MNLLDLIRKGIQIKASDIHLLVGVPPVFRVNGSLIKYGKKTLKSKEIKKIVEEILKENQLIELKEKKEIDIAYSISDIGRFRINVFKQKGSLSVSLRIIPLNIPTTDQLNLPTVVDELINISEGLILVTGPAGSGKTTTLASMINEINRSRNSHIITLEDPIEYIHIHNKSIINQREIGRDVLSFNRGLRAALRQDPDIILVGEMRDLETIKTVLTAAETGHLVLSTLHTSGAGKTMDRIIDVFPGQQQKQAKIQLSTVIQGVVYQQLLESLDKNGRVAAFEIMIANPAIRNLIREGKNYQIDTVIQTGKKEKMQTMDNSILELYRKRLISKEIALNGAEDREMLSKYL